MIYVVLFIIIGAMFIGSFIIITISKDKKMKQLKSDIFKDSKKEEVHIINSDIRPKNKRSNYRVNLNHVGCEVMLSDFGNPKLCKLKGKKIAGSIEDLSLSGLKFTSNYELPVRSHISIIVTFGLGDINLKLKGKIVRREDHVYNNMVSYGVQFAELPTGDKKDLNRELFKLQRTQYAKAL